MINVRGRIKVFNTINEFNTLNKNQILDELGESVIYPLFELKIKANHLILIFFHLFSTIDLDRDRERESRRRSATIDHIFAD